MEKFYWNFSVVLKAYIFNRKSSVRVIRTQTILMDKDVRCPIKM